jgi:hypothetical protein
LFLQDKKKKKSSSSSSSSSDSDAAVLSEDYQRDGGDHVWSL